MKRILLALTFATIIATVTTAQEKQCFTTEMDNEATAKNPDMLRQRHELENFIQQYATVERRNNSVVYVIPIVFHILHN